VKVTTTTIVDDGKDTTAAKAVYRGDVAGVLVKADEERKYTLTVAYPADKADKAVAADGHRDFASKDAVRQAAWSFLVKSPKVGLHHADGTDGAGTVVESFTWPGPDWSPQGAGYTVKEGDWLVGVVWSDEAWSLIKSGKVGGVSMQGSAKRRKPAPEALAGLRSQE
jgi:Putative phage serine protease XkdF